MFEAVFNQLLILFLYARASANTKSGPENPLYFERSDHLLKLGGASAGGLGFGDGRFGDGRFNAPRLDDVRLLPETQSRPPSDAPFVERRAPEHGHVRARFGRKLGWRDRLAHLDLVPDLGHNVGSRRWWRGVATLSTLISVTLWMAPGFQPITAPVSAPMGLVDRETTETLTIAPLAFGSDTGSRMGWTNAVKPIANAPQRAEVELTATLGQGDSFARMLQRAGVNGNDVVAAMRLIGGSTKVADIPAGTRFAIRLGKSEAGGARPLEAMTFRARFDLNLKINRSNGVLGLSALPIAVDTRPLRISGIVGEGLYRSARAAGGSPDTVQKYLRTLADQGNDPLDFAPTDRFDMIISQRRAESGEVILGDLQYAGIERVTGKTQLVSWSLKGQKRWFNPATIGETKSGFAVPVPGARVSSNYGWRTHPILRFLKLHTGTDYAAASGTPVHAASDGVIEYAGRKGGYGNFIRLNMGGGLATGYAHLSGFAVSPGQRVGRGQVIGYVGSTGMSTGPHLHYEMYKNGNRVDPRSVQYVQQSEMDAAQQAALKARLAELMAVPSGAGR